MLTKQTILEALSFFLIYVPQKEAERDKPERPAYTIFPRYHQSRMVQKVTQDALSHFTAQANIGKKYLIAHSSGSGETLSICCLADLDNLPDPDVLAEEIIENLEAGVESFKQIMESINAH